MSQDELEKRVIELEARVAFQDDTISQLNDVVIGQGEQLDRLERLCESMRARMVQLGTDGGANLDDGNADPFERDRPPHY